jgi:thiol-disulfide isomerase/thioredoxin
MFNYIATVMKRCTLLFLITFGMIFPSFSQVKDNNIEIVKGYEQINTIQNLLSHFKGRPVFVDLWASWCDPCKEEFKFSPNLYLELKKRNIEVLYISIDKDPLVVAWKKDMQNFKLAGNHVKANKALRDELTTLIWGGVDAFSIPNYMLFDGRGNLLLKSTLAPSTGTKLLNQIEGQLANQKDKLNDK